MKYLDKVCTTGPWPVGIGIAFDEATFKKGMRVFPDYEHDWPAKAEGACALLVHNQNGSIRLFACFDGAHLKKQSAVTRAGYVVHEASHLWCDIKKHCEAHWPDTETEAYMLQWIVERILEEFETWRKSK